MKKRKIIIISLLFVLIIIGIIFGVLWFLNNKKDNGKFIARNDIVMASDDTISLQAKVDSEIKDYINNSEFTIDNPKIMVNPYLISPLSAIIIFQTKDNVAYEVYVNDVLLTKMEASKKHAIPIYGLKPGIDNKIKIKSNGSEKEYKIPIEEDPYKLNIEVKNTNDKDAFYFLASPMGLGHAAFDGEGNLVWYVVTGNAQDIEFLSNGHILVVSDEAANGGFKGFYEIDYLGKIYHKYILENNYHQEVNELYNGNYLVLGSPDDATIANGYISIVDRNTGKEIKSLDLYEVLGNIDINLVHSIEDSELNDFNNNSAYYNENTDELILSIRNLNCIMSLNFSDKTINWIIGDENNFTDAFNKYFLHASDDSRSIKGGHSAFINKDGYLGYFNNDYDPNDDEDLLLSYKENYSSALYYELDLNNRTYRTAWEYIPKTHEWDYAMSSFNVTYDNHKLVNFGWSFEEQYYTDQYSLYDEIGTTYSRIIELDDNDNVLFNATLNESIYRAFKNKFYQEETKNYEVIEYSLIDATPYTELEEVSTKSIENNLEQAVDCIYDIEITKNSVNVDVVFDPLEEVQFIFVGGNGKSYIFNYKPANELPAGKVNIKLKGIYAIYLKNDDIYYDLHKTIDFGD